MIIAPVMRGLSVADLGADDDSGRARAALRAAGLWDGLSPLRLRRISTDAHSNLTFEAECATGHFALRLARADVEAFVDRAEEARAQALAWRCGVAAELVHVDAPRGILATRWIDGAEPMTPGSFGGGARLGRAARLLAQLHRSGACFKRTLEPRETIASYRASLRERGVDSVWSATVNSALSDATATMLRSATGPAPCHGDPAPGNFLDAPARMLLIDWEYAAMSDPAWDLGYLACEARLGEAAIAKLVAAYDDVAMTAERVAAAAIVTGAVSLLWTMLLAGNRPSLALKAAVSVRRATLEALATHGPSPSRA